MSTSSSTKPNIIFIHAESMDGRKMGCMGEPSMQNATPNLDSLAEDGVMFTNAYTNCPVCNPSRASMWTGKYPQYYDCWNNHEGLHDDVPIFRDTFNSAGYQTAALGGLDYQWGKHSIRDRVGSWTRAAEIKRPISRTPLPVISDDPSPYGRDWECTYQGLDFLHEASKSDRPFMMYLTTALVHPAFVGSRRHMEMIDEDKIEIPPTLGGMEMTDHPVMEYIRITKNCDKRFSEDLVHQMRHIYFGMIAALDEMVGRVLRTVEDLGLSDNTYIIFSSDHGEMAGEQNQILKRTMYEPSVHEPLLIRGPGVQQGAAVENPVSLIDIYPTLMDMAGLDYSDFSHHPGYPEAIDGESLMPLLHGDKTDRRDWVFSGYNGDRCCTGAYMLRRGPWKYVKYIGYPPQLFNLDEDPWEANDVAGEFPDVVTQMDDILESNFDPAAIDARAKEYDKKSFKEWRTQAEAEGIYEKTMSHVYSGFDRQCIEDLMPWTEADEARLQEWLGE
ncbi:MAG: sulfatase-like hydrolase/transferase [Armatimonadota bacterium]